MADEIHPDLIILDLMLPDAHGLVLCTNLKAKAAVPIIICSATKRQEDPTLAFKLGADDFIAKPFSVDELQARLDMALRRAAPRAATAGPAASGSWRIGELVIGFWALGYPGRSIRLLIVWVAAGALARGIAQIVGAFGLHKVQAHHR